MDNFCEVRGQSLKRRGTHLIVPSVLLNVPETVHLQILGCALCLHLDLGGLQVLFQLSFSCSETSFTDHGQGH